MKAKASDLVGSSGTVNASSMARLSAAVASASGLGPEWVTAIVRNSTGHVISEPSAATDTEPSHVFAEANGPVDGRALSDAQDEASPPLSPPPPSPPPSPPSPPLTPPSPPPPSPSPPAPPSSPPPPAPEVTIEVIINIPAGVSEDAVMTEVMGEIS
jgi:hypothetical protein